MKNNMKKHRIIVLLFSLIFLSSCQSVKDAVSGKKSKGADEFLVQKKNSLVLPPDFESLPKPETEITDKQEVESDRIKNLIVNQSTKKKDIKTDSTSTEKFILDKIKKN